ncbi:hypothetical protein KSS87_012556 [Heliosperma pusillum]|nr:hypothetical protein KSS87_012556 [Heliosperma pusillum]
MKMKILKFGMKDREFVIMKYNNVWEMEAYNLISILINTLPFYIPFLVFFFTFDLKRENL